MFAWSRRDGDFDAGVGGGEGAEVGAEEVVHAAAAAGPVAVVEVEAAALEDEGSDAVLCCTALVRWSFEWSLDGIIPAPSIRCAPLAMASCRLLN